ncbi:hypothetical protein HN358_00890 [Candidatus Uhrbacteria bacterium]|jgi:hypothetical protein|nr:hypothetical protein [Candidatus Uhrbacteria bacterium]MBT7717441.1 hypothetical protein [Candidatus Uhrbacteria bacterium]
MRNSIVFTILLIVSTVVELSIINTFGYPIFLFPLTLSIGVLMLHMLPITFGIMWLLLSPMLLSMLGAESMNIIPYILVVIVGTALTMRVFTRRSVYALIGLGIILISTFTFTSGILGIDIFSGHPYLKSLGYIIFEMTILLIIGFILIQRFRPVGSLFKIPRKT